MLPDIVFVHPERVHFIWLALAVGGAVSYFELHGQETLGRFMSSVMQARLAERPPFRRRLFRLGLIFGMLLLGVLALMRPQTRGVTESISTRRISADIMIALDVSKSMLAEDAAPNRLSRAKAEMSELLGKLHGHRVGLVAFAGRASVVCPLTSDYGFFRMILRGVDTRTVSRGGTRIGEALRKSVGAFRAGEGAKLILLITDGEDHDSYAEDAAKQALQSGVSIVAIGFGSEKGSPIILTDPDTGAKTTLTDKQGNEVQSRLDGELLRKIAEVTEGVYVPAGVAALDLDSILNAHIQPMVRAWSDTSVRVVPAEQYPWFILGSLLCLVGAAWLGALRGKRGLV